ncbi:hypothetical protein D9756_009977 [Leucocoprinus leucothites]|uniref:Uncharacterized protein n=1 Tax=Leucocoprinus leucothites TaxID=201217 RepID=A0A8H5FSQ0_9AGAR|nr:hypothetical protein D9756_009977 [Leucoagaricus leucothites]
MHLLDESSISFQRVLPLLFVLALSTIFNAILTWNDFRLLSSLRRDSELKYLPGRNEAPISLKPVLQLVDANGHYGMSADVEWATLLPSNHATGIHLDPTHERPYFISAYHQISCLNTLRKLYVNPGWADDTRKKDTAHHCLNVLRQAVLCNGDTTLEPSHPESHSNGKAVAAASGMEVLHRYSSFIRKLITLTDAAAPLE